ncbi:sulfotransferase [bacterium]|nr:sulfotransferase [bacterium]
MNPATQNTVHVILCSGHSGSRLLVRLLAENGVYMGARRGGVGEDNQDFGELLWSEQFRRQVVAHWKYPGDSRLLEPIHAGLLRAHRKFMSGLADVKTPAVAVGTKNATQFPYVAGLYRDALAAQGVRVKFIHLTRDPRMWMLSGRDPDSRGVVRPARHPRFSLLDDPFNRYVWTRSFAGELETPLGEIRLSDYAVYSEERQIALEARFWATTNSIAAELGSEADGYLHLRYEDLILDPAAVFAQLSEFMGVSLTHEPAGGTRIRTDRVQRDPVMAVGEGTARLIAATCSELMDRFGYARSGKRRASGPNGVAEETANGSAGGQSVALSTGPAIHTQHGCGLRPVFVVGCMRSGTTILGKVLDSHPGLKQIGWEMNDEWSTLGCAPSGLVCESRHAGEATEQARVAMDGFFRSKLAKAGPGVRPVNKSPHLGNKLDYVRALFPDAQFIHIVRDPFSHTNSMKSHFERITYQQRQSVAYWPDNGEKPCWQQFTVQQAAERDLPLDRIYPGEGFARIPEAWTVINGYIAAELGSWPADAATVIHYNRLVTDPAGEAARLFAFLGLDTGPAEAVPALMGGSDGLVNSQTRNPLEEWQKTLSSELVDEIHRQLHRHVSELAGIERWLRKSYGDESLSVLPVRNEVLADER